MLTRAIGGFRLDLLADLDDTLPGDPPSQFLGEMACDDGCGHSAVIESSREGMSVVLMVGVTWSNRVASLQEIPWMMLVNSWSFTRILSFSLVVIVLCYLDL